MWDRNAVEPWKQIPAVVNLIFTFFGRLGGVDLLSPTLLKAPVSLDVLAVSFGGVRSRLNSSGICSMSDIRY